MDHPLLQDAGLSSVDVFQVSTHLRESSADLADHILELRKIPSTEAISQTDSFPHSLVLAFDDPAAADRAYEVFQIDGNTPAHGRGPWVVFIGRTPGVFTS